MKTACSLLAAVVAIVSLGLAASQGRAAEAGGACVHRAAPAGAVGKRVAIIVGDGAYKNGIPALPNPIHDTEATSRVVAALGFEVFLSTDADSAALERCLDEAYAGLANTDVAMFYYSGHGIQIQDANYLVATDASAGDLKRGFVAVQPIVDALQKQAKATLVLLDACRNNPLTENGQPGLSISLGRGLARVKDPAIPGNAPLAGTPGVVQARGLMVAYATSPNAVALDGSGNLSPFTAAFVKVIGASGYSVQRVMSEVNRSVGEATDWKQTPWMKSSLTGELKLGGGETLAEAQSISDNHAARSTILLDNDAKKEQAIIEALKGLPAAPDAAALTRFRKAYLALYRAVQGTEIVLPLSPGMTEVAVSTQDRAAVFRLNADYHGGTFDLWSISDQKIVAKPDVGRSGATEKFAFSPHGTLLAVVTGNSTIVLDGRDGSKKIEMRNAASGVQFSPDESRLLLQDSRSEKLVIVDVATGEPTVVVKMAQLEAGIAKQRETYVSQVEFGGNETLCFGLTTGGEGRTGVLGVFDLKQNRVTRVRRLDEAVSTMMCDPAGKYMVRTFPVGASNQGMEIWDLVNDKVDVVNSPVDAIMGIQPQGDYVSVLATTNDAAGFYRLATGKKGYPPTVPDGYSILGARVRDAAGGLVSQDTNPNPWRDWPDETLFGPALVKKALAGLTDAQREAVSRERITYVEVAANP